MTLFYNHLCLSIYLCGPVGSSLDKQYDSLSNVVFYTCTVYSVHLQDDTEPDAERVHEGTWGTQMVPLDNWGLGDLQSGLHVHGDGEPIVSRVLKRESSGISRNSVWIFPRNSVAICHIPRNSVPRNFGPTEFRNTGFRPNNRIHLQGITKFRQNSAEKNSYII